jgi:hypothetical protein
MPSEGWMERQYKKATEDAKKWPAWMQREAGIEAALQETFSEERHPSDKPDKDSNKKER